MKKRGLVSVRLPIPVFDANPARRVNLSIKGVGCISAFFPLHRTGNQQR